MIPIINLKLASQNFNLFSKKIGDAMHNIGFLALENHGIPQQDMNLLKSSWGKFFDLPMIKKKKYEIEELAGQRGYSQGKESAAGYDTIDLKEFWHIGRNSDPQDLETINYPSNIYVPEVPLLQAHGERMYFQFEELGKLILKAIAQYLQLPRNYFEKKVRNGNSILRLLNYPPIAGDTDGAIRAEQHGDINLITLLLAGSESGLQVLNKNKNWLDAQVSENQMVINTGDMMARLTNNFFPSTVHRVINPSGINTKKSRQSFPFFMHPRSDMDLTCLEQCVSTEHPKAYKDMFAGKFLDERLIELGLKSK